MELSARLYHCVRCHCQVVICSHCDRGNIYCRSCAPLARQEFLRAADQRYQNTHQGKLKHAERQRRYRERQNQKVTDQSSIEIADEVSLKAEQSESKKCVAVTKVDEICCHFCKKPCYELLRLGFLQNHSHQNASMT